MIASISDIHIKSPEDERARLFRKFLKHPEVLSSKYLFLLGDIFDLMVGPHPEYLETFNEIFSDIAKLVNEGVRVYYFEGNHDFHLDEFFSLYISEFDLGTSFFHSPQDLQININGQEFYCAHGDDIEIDNPMYKVYKKAIRNRPMNFIANRIVPYDLVEGIGGYLSSKSRERNQSRYDLNNDQSMSEVRDRFRRSCDFVKMKSPEVSFILSGHSHVQDNYLSKKGYRYLNNGFFPKTKKFIKINKDLSSHFISID